MKKYHKALEAYDRGLQIEPQNAELQQGKMWTMMSIQNSASGNDDDDKVWFQQAMNDPEIQMIVKDPRI